jgi:hypothetical protein
MLEPRAEGTVHIVILACKSILSMITQRIELVAPMTVEVEPLCRCGWAESRGAKGVTDMVVRVHVGVEKWIPKRSSVCLIMQKTPWKDV